MSVLYILYVMVVGAMILHLTVVSHFKSSAHSALYKRYTANLIATLFNKNSTTTIITSSRHQRNTLIEAIHSLTTHTYDSQREVIKRVVKENNLQEHIFRLLRHASSLQKCRLLTLLSSINLENKTHISIIKKYLHCHNHNIRSHALITLIAAKPTELIPTISSLNFELQPTDTARIITLIRQGTLCVVIEPLLESNNRNLQMLALAIVRSFGIDIADKHLLQIVASSQCSTLVEDAIYTLTALKRPLKYRIIKERLAEASEQQRKKLCRHLSVEGYSIQSIRALLSSEECHDARLLITSYKRQLSQSQTP
ncbi:MAG: hypothetical protein II299_04810 [Alistipes sp.]|nr:hypothetical protein [Alistipes sp.]